MSSVFKIYSPEDCDFYYDGELQGHIEGNSKKAFRFEVERKGVYRLEFINSEYQTELMLKVSIDADEEREVELDFSEVNEPAIQERERIIIAIEHDYEAGEQLPEEILSVISKNGIVTIPQGVRKIGDHTFFGCNSLTSITIPESVTKIGEFAFAGCSCLTSVTIPESVTEIGYAAFRNCSRLTGITIPESVTEIGGGAFYSCGRLAGITIPKSITEIGYAVFSGCSSLRSTTIPESVTEIGDDAFYGCISLRSITIPESVTTIGKFAFGDCNSLISITIPESITEIRYAAFNWCSSLTSVYCKATTPPKLEDGIFNKTASDLKIYVPKSECSTVLEAYTSAADWRSYARFIEEYDFDNE